MVLMLVLSLIDKPPSQVCLKIRTILFSLPFDHYILRQFNICICFTADKNGTPIGTPVFILFCFYVRARMYVYIFLSHVACMPLPNECGATNCFPDSFELAIHLS